MEEVFSWTSCLIDSYIVWVINMKFWIFSIPPDLVLGLWIPGQFQATFVGATIFKRDAMISLIYGNTSWIVHRTTNEHAPMFDFNVIVFDHDNGRDVSNSQ